MDDVFFSLSSLNIGEQHIKRVVDPGAVGINHLVEVLEKVSSLERLEITETTLSTPPSVNDKQAFMDYMDWIAEEIIPRL